MASENRQFLTSALTSVLKPHEFRKKGLTWLQKSDDLTKMIAIHKISGLDAYNFIIGVYFHTIEEKDKIKWSDSHIYRYIGRFDFYEITDNRDPFDFETNMSEADRSIFYYQIIKQIVFPWYSIVNSFENAMNAVKLDRLPESTLAQIFRENMVP